MVRNGEMQQVFLDSMGIDTTMFYRGVTIFGTEDPRAYEFCNACATDFYSGSQGVCVYTVVEKATGKEIGTLLDPIDDLYIIYIPSGGLAMRLGSSNR